jgi:hydrogenase maturation factor
MPNEKLPTGKVPADVLKRYVFNNLGLPSDRVLKGPNIGEDAAVLDMGDRVIVVATDPITGAERRIGWLSVHVNANDVASCGAKPSWFLATTLLPEEGDESILKEIMDDMNVALCQIGVSLIGGHTETTPGLERPIIIGFMLGETSKDKYVTTGGAQSGDHIILTKGAGIEGTSIIAQEFSNLLEEKLEREVIKGGAELIERISVVPEAMLVMKTGEINSLHDPTEGGILNGLWEMAEASGVGLKIFKEKIPIEEETRKICATLNIDPLKLLGSGALIIVTNPDKSEEIIEILKDKGIKASIIGEITDPEEGRFIIERDGSSTHIVAIEQDELYRILEDLRS